MLYTLLIRFYRITTQSCGVEIRSLAILSITWQNSQTWPSFHIRQVRARMKDLHDIFHQLLVNGGQCQPVVID